MAYPPCRLPNCVIGQFRQQAWRRDISYPFGIQKHAFQHPSILRGFIFISFHACEFGDILPTGGESFFRPRNSIRIEDKERIQASYLQSVNAFVRVCSNESLNLTVDSSLILLPKPSLCTYLTYHSGALPSYEFRRVPLFHACCEGQGISLSRLFRTQCYSSEADF